MFAATSLRSVTDGIPTRNKVESNLVKVGQGWSSLARVAGDEPMQAGRLRYGPSRTRRRTLPKSGRIRVNQTKSDQIKPENEDDDEDEDDFLNPLK